MLLVAAISTAEVIYVSWFCIANVERRQKNSKRNRNALAVPSLFFF
jgi:hypothetical protein